MSFRSTVLSIHPKFIWSPGDSVCGCKSTDSIIRNETAINCVKKVGGAGDLRRGGGRILYNAAFLYLKDKIRSYLLRDNEFQGTLGAQN